MIRTLAFALLLIPILGHADTAPWLMESSYKDGFTLCETENANDKELSGRISVPVDYHTPQGETFSLYYWLHKKFEPTLPTVFFINGGPGDTARDIDQIRKHLKVDKISIYAVSYGTAPATIYGHLFPQATTAITLEGVIFEGGRRLIEPRRKRQILQSYFDNQSAERKQKILALSEISPVWFSGLGSNLLYLNNSESALNHLLDYIFSLDAESAMTFIRSFLPQTPHESHYGFDHVMMGMIGCQELGMNLTGMSSYLEFAGQRLRPHPQNHFLGSYCVPLGLSVGTPEKLYSATKYPLTVSVTYIQGTHDGATSAHEAIRHFKYNKAVAKNMILIKQGGHLPLFEPLGSGFESGPAIEERKTLLNILLRGQPASKILLQNLSAVSGLHWLQATSRKDTDQSLSGL